MKEDLRKHLVQEIAKDLWENPDDSLAIFEGLKAGYPKDAIEIGLEAIQIVRDRKLLEDPDLQQSLKEMREGKTVRL